jgi:hypothetical protein
MGGKSFEQPDGPTQVATTLPMADIENAAGALRTYCPGLAA